MADSTQKTWTARSNTHLRNPTLWQQPTNRTVLTRSWY